MNAKQRSIQRRENRDWGFLTMENAQECFQFLLMSTSIEDGRSLLMITENTHQEALLLQLTKRNTGKDTLLMMMMICMQSREHLDQGYLRLMLTESSGPLNSWMMDTKINCRISSDDNGVHSVARVSIEIEERRSSRISPYDKEQRLQRVCNADEKECHRARTTSVEHSRERIHSGDRRVPESPVAADLCHRLTLSSLDDGGVQQEELTARHKARSLDHWKPKITEESPPMRRRHQEESSLEYYDDEQQQNSSNSRTLPPPSSTRSRVGRSIFFTVADEHSEHSTTHEEKSFILQSNSVSGLKEELQVRTNIDEDIFICIRNPANGKLCILTLELPPNNLCMRVVVVRVNSEGTHIHFSLWEPLFRTTLLLSLQTKLVVVVEVNFEGNHILFSLWEPLFRTSISTLLLLLLLLLLSFANKTTYIQNLSSATLLHKREETERRQICRKT